MSCTRIGRIRKLIKKTRVAKLSNVRDRDELREIQLRILIQISKEHKNDGRFRVKKGGSGGKRKAKEPKEGKGKRKKK